MKFKNKRGLMLGEAFGAVLVLTLLGVLVIIAVYLFQSLSTSMTPAGRNCTDSAACNATQTMITQFGTFPSLVGLVGTIIFLGIVIGVLVGSFAFGGPSKGRA